MSRGHGHPAHRGVRIIAGRWRGRRLKLPAGTQVRPTPDRVRETLFNWLGERIVGARCLDLYAGSGVLGLEALSRGAGEVEFVEHDRRLATGIAAALEMLDARARVTREHVERFLEHPAAATDDVVFLDPPYDLDLVPVIARLGPRIGPGTQIYVERADADGLPVLPGLVWRRQGRAGAVCYGLAQRA